MKLAILALLGRISAEELQLRDTTDLEAKWE